MNIKLHVMLETKRPCVSKDIILLTLGEGICVLIFRLFKSILFFVKFILLYFFHLLYSTNMLCLLLLY